MSNIFDRPLLGASRTAVGAWNRAKFEEVVDMIGARVANNLAIRFREDLRKRFTNMSNRESLRRDVHAVRSSSELLGFAKLSQAARRLETAFETGEAFDASLAALMIAKDDTIQALDESLAPGQTAT